MATALDEYQVATRETAVYPDISTNYMYPLLGLTGEVGELANKVKKIFRDDNGILTAERRLAIREELGDVLWYLARTADEFGFTLSEIGDNNLARLKDRKKRNVISGSGDTR
jgi:NTP pyrophosphatase (non-canonical NTP hydrolase)